MDYFNFITSMVAFVENRLTDDIDHRELEKSFGYSTAHIREIFRDSTKISLSKYILYRKICNAAFEIAHDKKRTILDIANGYGFDSYDTFTRAFKRYLLMTPKDFRKSGIPIGRIRLGVGVYGPGVIKSVNSLYNPPDFWEEFNMAKDIKKSEESCILYGVPRVKYCYEAIKEKCYKAAKYFKQEFTVARKMGELIEENQPRETQARKLGEPLVRKELAKCIMEAKKLDYSGCEVLKEIVEII